MKEIGGDVVRAELIEFASATAFEADYSNLHRFTGTVTAYNESRQAVAVGSFETGDNPECPPPSIGTPGNGGGSGGGWEPVFPMPGNPEDPYNPLPMPGWPSSPGSTETPPQPPAEGCIPKETKEVAVIAGLTMMTDGCIVWFEGVFTPSTSKLSPHCNDGSGVIILPRKQETPCALTKKTLDNPTVQDGISELKNNAKTPGVDEDGFIENPDGTISPVEDKKAHSVKFGDKSGKKGGYHNHTLVGISIFSPQDVREMLGFAVATQPNISEGYVGMIAANRCNSGSDCINGFKFFNFIIRYTGNYNDLIYSNFTDEQLNKWKEEMQLYELYLRDDPTKYTLVDGSKYMTEDALFEIFQEVLKKMNLLGKVELQKEDTNGVVTVKFNPDNTIDKTTCP